MLDGLTGEQKALFNVSKVLLKLINNSSKENKEHHYRDRGLDMCS